jgi:hypothetical protein
MGVQGQFSLDKKVKNFDTDVILKGLCRKIVLKYLEKYG